MRNSKVWPIVTQTILIQKIQWFHNYEIIEDAPQNFPKQVKIVLYIKGSK